MHVAECAIQNERLVMPGLYGVFLADSAIACGRLLCTVSRILFGLRASPLD